MSLFHWFWTHSGPTFANRGQIGRGIVERIEGRMLWLQELGCADRIGGANDHFLGKEALFKKTRRFDQEVNLHFSTNGIELDPKKAGGKITHGPGVRTRLSTFEKCANS